MGCRDFEVSSDNGVWATTTGYASLGTAHSHAALLTVESIPAGSLVVGGMGNGGAAVDALLVFANTVSWSLTYNVGTNNVAPGANIVPPTGVPLLIAASKAAGTVAPTFLMHRYDTMVTTVNAAGATVANRTAGANTAVIGNIVGAGAGVGHDGQIGALAQWNRALSEGELRALIGGRPAWQSMFGRGVLTNAAEFFIDLTQPGTIRDQFNPSIVFTSGTQPAFDPATIRWPGW